MIEPEPIRCGCGGPVKTDNIFVLAHDNEYDCEVEMPMYRVFCKQCGISTPFAYPSKTDAITSWNRAMSGKYSPE